MNKPIDAVADALVHLSEALMQLGLRDPFRIEIEPGHDAWTILMHMDPTHQRWAEDRHALGRVQGIEFLARTRA